LNFFVEEAEVVHITSSDCYFLIHVRFLPCLFLSPSFNLFLLLSFTLFFPSILSLFRILSNSQDKTQDNFTDPYRQFSKEKKGLIYSYRERRQLPKLAHIPLQQPSKSCGPPEEVYTLLNAVEVLKL
jgi:hypothetical protein